MAFSQDALHSNGMDETRGIRKNTRAAEGPPPVTSAAGSAARARRA